jgi:hypothetical protein
VSNNNQKETESPDIIEELIPGKNKDHDHTSTNQGNNNNQDSSNGKYNLQESAESVIKDLKEPEGSPEGNTGGAGNQDQATGHNYTIADTHKQTAQATSNMAENFSDYQKQSTNTFQAVFLPYFENINNQFWNNQEFFRLLQKTYSTMISMYTENLIVFSRIFANMASSNAGFFKKSFNQEK